MSRSTRRTFLQMAGLTAGALSVSHVATSSAQESTTGRDGDAVLARLIEGNKRFAGGQSTRVARTPKDFANDAAGQAPLAAILACADSRVGPELVFDQGVGELFVVRVAGNVFSGSGPLVKGSIEYAVAELGVRLVMVMGHSQCGAVKAAIEHIDDRDALPGSIRELVGLIQPAVTAAQGRSGDRLNNVIRANVERCVARVKGLDPILSAAMDRNQLKVVGGVYELSTGLVEIVA